MDVFDKILKENSWRFPKGYPDMNDPSDKKFLFDIVEGYKYKIKEEEVEEDIEELRANLVSFIKNISNANELKQITKYTKNVGFGNSMKDHLSSKNLSNKDILFFQSLLSDMGKTGEFSKIAENPPKFDITNPNYFDQIQGFSNSELISLYGDMKDSIQGTVSLGPGEAFLSVFFNNVSKAKDKGDLNIDGKEVELKSRTGASGALVVPSYVVRGKSAEYIQNLIKLVDTLDLDKDQKEEIKNLITPKGTTWPFKVNTLYQSALNFGIDNKVIIEKISDKINFWYKNKLSMDISSYFTGKEFESDKFIVDLAKNLAKDYFEEHQFDGFMISDNKGNFKYYEGNSFINAIGTELTVQRPSDLVPRIKI